MGSDIYFISFIPITLLLIHFPSSLFFLTILASSTPRLTFFSIQQNRPRDDTQNQHCAGGI